MIERIDKNWLVLGVSAALMISVPWWLLSREPEEIQKSEPLLITKVTPQEIVTLNALVEKPIFNAQRAPQAFAGEMTAEALQETEVAQQAAPAPTLVGLVSRRRGKSVAIVKDSEGQTKTLAPGQSADGWQLLSVSRTNARFASAGTEISVALDFGNKAIGGPSGAPQSNDIDQENKPLIGEAE